MSIVAVSYGYSGDVRARELLLPVHRDYLRGLAEHAGLVVAGPHAQGEPRGALLLFRATDKTAVQTLVDNDPFTTAGVVATVQIVAWNPVIGPLATVLGSTEPAAGTLTRKERP